jgi:hypothetical protein
MLHQLYNKNKKSIGIRNIIFLLITEWCQLCLNPKGEQWNARDPDVFKSLIKFHRPKMADALCIYYLKMQKLPKSRPFLYELNEFESASLLAAS